MNKKKLCLETCGQMAKKSGYGERLSLRDHLFSCTSSVDQDRKKMTKMYSKTTFAVKKKATPKAR